MAEVKSIEDSLQDMKKRKLQTEGMKVEEYLKRGRSAMGLGDMSGLMSFRGCNGQQQTQ
jgi:hypothetical protein